MKTFYLKEFWQSKLLDAMLLPSEVSSGSTTTLKSPGTRYTLLTGTKMALLCTVWGNNYIKPFHSRSHVHTRTSCSSRESSRFLASPSRSGRLGILPRPWPWSRVTCRDEGLAVREPENKPPQPLLRRLGSSSWDDDVVRRPCHVNSPASLDRGACYLRSTPPLRLRASCWSSGRQWCFVVQLVCGQSPTAAALDGAPRGQSRVSCGRIRRRADVDDDDDVLTPARLSSWTSKNTFDYTNSTRCRPVVHSKHANDLLAVVKVKN